MNKNDKNEYFNVKESNHIVAKIRCSSKGYCFAVREKNKEQLRIKAAVELAKSKDGLSWLEVSFDDMKGKFVTYPDRSELSSEINENLIIELYSK